MTSEHPIPGLTSDPIPHKTRQYQSYPGASYVLPADENEITRLNIQHELLKIAFDGKLFFPPFNNESAYLILDSGTGTGAWMLDVASQLSPSAIIHGIDIESRLFPKEHPQNISFSINSIANLPDAWKCKFDYIHQRFLIAALKSSEWRLALKHIARVLVPGGWVQLSEVGILSSGPVTDKHRDMLKALFKARDMMLNISTEIPALLQGENFTNVQMLKRTLPIGAWAGKLGIDSRDNFITMFRGMKTPILHAGGLGYVKTEKEYDDFMDAVEKEWDETEGSELELFTFYAQSPFLK